jgi:hypothetical protein
MLAIHHITPFILTYFLKGIPMVVLKIKENMGEIQVSLLKI